MTAVRTRRKPQTEENSVELEPHQDSKTQRGCCLWSRLILYPYLFPVVCLKVDKVKVNVSSVFFVNMLSSEAKKKLYL